VHRDGEMSLTAYSEGAVRPRRRVRPLAISAALHGVAFFALMNAPEIRLPERSQSEYKQAIAGKEEKLVWYKLKDLPNVTPPDPNSERKPLKATVLAKQQIVASRKDAPKKIRMVQTPAPEVKETPVELPNILAIRIPEITKPFVAPPDIQKPAPKVEIAADAPALPPQAINPVKLADAPKLVKNFVPPPRRVPKKLTEVAMVDNAPPLEAAPATPSDALNYSFKVPARPFTAPPASKPSAAGRVSLVDDPAPNVELANSRDLNVAAIGLNPANVPIRIPEYSSPGQFSAGPKLRPDGANAAGEGKGVTVPDLYVRGDRGNKTDLLADAFAAPTSSRTLREVARANPPRSDADRGLEKPAEKTPGAVKVSSAPDPRFTGRDIYMMAIQMPNLTSFSGSWLMWYADRTAREVGLAPVAPPVAHRKVDPKYIASAAAEHVEGKVQLACVIAKDGHVSHVELVRGLDDRLNQSAEEALAKWEFDPATRHGVPVEVDVLVEIPFQLEHIAPVHY
jgi:TonB family protein